MENPFTNQHKSLRKILAESLWLRHQAEAEQRMNHVLCQSIPCGLPQEMRAEVNSLLTRAAAADPEQRITLDEMLAAAGDWCRRLEG